MLRDVAISRDRNVIMKESGKILKYSDHIIAIKRMLNAVTKVIPLKTGSTGTLLKIIQEISEPHAGETRNKRNYSKTAVLDSARVLWKVLMYK